MLDGVGLHIQPLKAGDLAQSSRNLGEFVVGQTELLQFSARTCSWMELLQLLERTYSMDDARLLLRLGIFLPSNFSSDDLTHAKVANCTSECSKSGSSVKFLMLCASVRVCVVCSVYACACFQTTH